jgi:hypothetical protein
MDEMGIRRIRENVFMNIVSDAIYNIEETPYPSEIIDLIKEMKPSQEKDQALQEFKMPKRFHYMKECIEKDLKEDSTNFELGDPEEEIPCDFSCRGQLN